MLSFKKFKIKRGFTLIEIIVTMLILFITLAMVSPLLNYNLKSLYITENKNDLQREANYSLENFINKAMQATKIEEISESNTDPDDTGFISCKSDSTVKSIKYIKFCRVDQIATGTGGNYNYIFIYDSNSKTLKYGETDDNVNMQVAQDIDDIKVEPLPLGKSFDKCSGIKVQVKFSKHLVDSYVLTSQVKFRNYP
ncbi:type II secretion system protein [Clostridium magnum]|uniref:type II secretion system protein n=1 Tax=Clostridium magnum TaxID=33954 RepID=UPI000833CDFB|nr:type II secretion system protein [Clostridium magnum]